MAMSPLDVIKTLIAEAEAGRPVVDSVDSTGTQDSYFYTLTTNHSNSLLKELDINIGKLGDIGSFDSRVQSSVKQSLESPSSELGSVLKRIIPGKKFYDLGCGSPSNSFVIRFIAEQLGAKEYNGVDLNNVNNQTREDEFNNGNKFSSKFIRADLLEYLGSNFNEDPSLGKVFYISGLEHNIFKDTKHRYVGYAELCMQRIADNSNTGDIVIIGPRTTGFDPERFGYRCIYGDKSVHSHSIYEKV